MDFLESFLNPQAYNQKRWEEIRGLDASKVWEAIDGEMNPFSRHWLREKQTARESGQTVDGDTAQFRAVK